MEQFLTMFGNYKTTLVGFIAALVVYEAGVGNKLPASRQEWWALALSVIAQALGLVSKDATTGSKPLMVLLACGLAAGGCATLEADVAKVVTDLSQFTSADLDQAIAMAGAASPAVDPGAAYRARCYVTLKKYVPTGQTVGGALLPKGVVSTLEKAMELDARLRSGSGIPADVHADCAVLAMNAAEFAGRVGLKLAPLPGAGALPLR